MWSSAYLTIPEYVSCVIIMDIKISNKDIQVKTNTNFDLFPMPEEFRDYSGKIFFVDYNPDTYVSAARFDDLMVKRNCIIRLIDYKLKNYKD